MTREKLSHLFSYSTQEIQVLTTALYESLHDDMGRPTNDWDGTLDEVKKYKKAVIMELESIKNALAEFNELSEKK
tara:strand:+ start:7438 stop:7662 length:225 start_codon:yes stop_codon:yes gene_type:complete